MVFRILKVNRGITDGDNPAPPRAKFIIFHQLAGHETLGEARQGIAGAISSRFFTSTFPNRNEEKTLANPLIKPLHHPPDALCLPSGVEG